MVRQNLPQDENYLLYIFVSCMVGIDSVSILNKRLTCSPFSAMNNLRSDPWMNESIYGTQECFRTEMK